MNDFLVISPCVEVQKPQPSRKKGSIIHPLTAAERRELYHELGIFCTAAFAAGFELTDLARNLRLPNKIVAIWVKGEPTADQQRVILTACRNLRQRLGLPTLDSILA